MLPSGRPKVSFTVLTPRRPRNDLKPLSQAFTSAGFLETVSPDLEVSDTPDGSAPSISGPSKSDIRPASAPNCSSSTLPANSTQELSDGHPVSTLPASSAHNENIISMPASSAQVLNKNEIINNSINFDLGSLNLSTMPANSAQENSFKLPNSTLPASSAHTKSCSSTGNNSSTPEPGTSWTSNIPSNQVPSSVSPSPVAAHTRQKRKLGKNSKNSYHKAEKNLKLKKKKSAKKAKTNSSPEHDTILSMPFFPVNNFSSETTWPSNVRTGRSPSPTLVSVSPVLERPANSDRTDSITTNDLFVPDSQSVDNQAVDVSPSMNNLEVINETPPPTNINSSSSDIGDVPEMHFTNPDLGGYESSEDIPNLNWEADPLLSSQRRNVIDEREFWASQYRNADRTIDAVTVDPQTTNAEEIPGENGNSAAINNNESPTSENSYATLNNPHSTSRMDCPIENIVENGYLKILFPILGPLKCTEQNCSAKFSGKDWMTKKGTLIKHLQFTHKMPKPAVRKWCLICSEDISRLRNITKHACLKDIQQFCPPDNEVEELEFKCPVCSFSSATKMGIKNHFRKHEKDTFMTQAAAERSARKNIPDTNSTPNTGIPGLQVTAHYSPASDTSNLSAVEINDAPPTGTQGSNSSSPSQSIENILDEGSGDISELEGSAEDNMADELETFIPNPDAASPSDKFLERFKDLLRNYSDSNWESFEALVSEFTEFAQEVNGMKKENKIPFKSKPNNKNNPTFIQRLYRRNRRRAIRLIREDTKSQCEISAEVLKQKYYSGSAPELDLSVYQNVVPATTSPDDMPFTSSEVFGKLKKCENTAPGPDSLTYFHLKKTDLEAKVLTLIYNYCLKAKKIPRAWKVSKTVLIPKSGDPSLPENWRPVALSSTLYKLFASLIAKRISDWVESNDVLSKCQKGFRPFDGTVENNYILKERIQNCRRKKKELFILLIDVKNAFGSISPAAIIEALKSAGIGDTYLALIQDLYENNTTHLLTAEGLSDEIAVLLGVKQGCPLSGPMFNLTVNPLFPLIQALREKFHILGYADDIAIMEDSIEALQDAIEKVTNFMKSLGLQINPKKCATVHIDPKRADCRNTIFKINGTAIPALRKFETTDYLGKPVGFNIFSNKETMDDFIQYGTQILSSYLAPWQRIDALKTFFYPSLNYAMRTDQFSKTDWKSLDKALKPLIKKTLNLPDRASTDYIYGNSKDGLFGIPLAAEDSDIAKIDSAFKLLMSIDPNVKNHAWEDLKLCSGDRVSQGASTQDMANFLSDVRYAMSSNHFSSLWARARTASGRLGVTWFLSDDRKVTIRIGDISITDKRNVFKELRNHFRSMRSQALASKPHQGKTFSCYSRSKASTHYHREGDYLRFADWRWVHKARLGLVKLNGYSETDPEKMQCRRCGYERETLPHVVNCCKKMLSNKVTKRHNRIVARIKKAALGRWTIFKENQCIGSEKLKPDLILVDGKEEALIIDVTMPFENRYENFTKARADKVKKYEKLATELKSSFKKVSCEAIIVGPLGSWDRRNDRVIARLCSRKYSNLMRKLIVSDTIRASRDIYYEHVTGIPQTDNRSRTFEIEGSESAPPRSRYGRKNQNPTLADFVPNTDDSELITDTMPDENNRELDQNTGENATFDPAIEATETPVNVAAVEQAPPTLLFSHVVLRGNITLNNTTSASSPGQSPRGEEVNLNHT